MSEMIHRVAKAINPRAWGDPNEYLFDDWRKQAQNRALAQARAAIEAMREPTISMVWCGARATQGDDLHPTNGEVNAAWRAMIDSALTEGDEK